MNKKRTIPGMRCKVLYILPLALLALCAFATSKQVEVVQNGKNEQLNGIDKTV